MADAPICVKHAPDTAHETECPYCLLECVKAEAARLREYAAHKSHCRKGIIGSRLKVQACNCGLSEVLAAPPAASAGSKPVYARDAGGGAAINRLEEWNTDATKIIEGIKKVETTDAD